MAESISISRASSISIRARDECAKRARGTPTGVTPKQLAKRRLVGSTSKRQLSFSDLSISDSTIARDWSTSEKRVLVEYIEGIGDKKNWVYSKKISTWEKASVVLKQQTGILRTSKCLKAPICTERIGRSNYYVTTRFTTIRITLCRL